MTDGFASRYVRTVGGGMVAGLVAGYIRRIAVIGRANRANTAKECCEAEQWDKTLNIG